jgi:hypothetical protein
MASRRPLQSQIFVNQRSRMWGEAKPGESANKMEVGGASVDSLARVARSARTDRPPPYGAQHRQDALWSGE